MTWLETSSENKRLQKPGNYCLRETQGYLNYTAISSLEFDIYASTIHFVQQHSVTKNPKESLAHNSITDAFLGNLLYQKPSFLSEKEYRAWEIFDILLNTHSRNLTNRFSRWLSSDTAQIQDSLAKYEAKHSDDPWAPALIILSCGNIGLVSKLAQKLKDYHLASLLAGPEELDVRQSAQTKIRQLQQDGLFRDMSDCHQKIWCVLGGQLGYCAWTETVIVEDLDWKLVLGLHVWNGTRESQTLYHAIQLYNEALSYLPGVHSILSRRKTASPPAHCLWVGILRLWASNMPIMAVTKERKERRSVDLDTLSVDKWPLNFLWLLTLQKPGWFTEDEIYKYTKRWCSALQEFGLVDEAVFSALFLKHEASRETLVKDILQSGEMENNDYLLDELHIPKLWIQQAKAARAHLASDYGAEADYYFELNQFEEAKYIILNYLVPAHMFNDETGLVPLYLLKLDLPDQKDKEGHVLFKAYRLIGSLSNQIDGSIGHSEAIKTLKTDIKTMIDRLKEVQTNYSHANDLVFFVHRICGKLLRAAARFDDQFFLDQLLTTTPLTPEECQLSIKEFSRSFIASFIDQTCT
ncbi:nuclear protein 96-domain-containing protein [Phycomyces nitens]|nr:nuclear protein 96-domain-containing protein [Phycomyces nitens]